jgi:membrane fusion protein (multidrug efflux system)
VITIPASSVSYAPYGDSVFIVEDMKPKGADGQETANAKPYKGCAPAVRQAGPVARRPGGRPHRTEAGRGGRDLGGVQAPDGAAVQVNNERQPGNNAAPKPEDS